MSGEKEQDPRLPVYCAWCEKHMSGPRVANHRSAEAGASHGICAECFEKAMAEFNDEGVKESVGTFEEFIARKCKCRSKSKCSCK